MSAQETLKLFSEKFDRLESSGLIGDMRKNGWKFSWDMKRECLSEKAHMPDLELLEAYVLNLRFFIQNREPVSWQNMSELYQAKDIAPEHREYFEEVRMRFNSELDREWWFRINDKPITYREIFEGMIYSQLAHSKQTSTHELFRGLDKSKFTYHFTMDAFLRCIDLSHRCLTIIDRLNKEAFANNKSLKADALKGAA